jgi:hypothetical protein
MQICIVGHSKGLGNFVYSQLQKEHSVIGLSRENGYDLTKNMTSMISIAKQADILFLNAYVPKLQIHFLKNCINFVDKIIVSGSLASFFEEIIPGDYADNKKELQKICQYKSLDNSVRSKILHLNLSCIEGNNVDINDPNAIQCGYETQYVDIYNTIRFWIENPCFSEVTFNFKITDLFSDQIRNKIGTGQYLDNLKQKINSI